MTETTYTADDVRSAIFLGVLLGILGCAVMFVLVQVILFPLTDAVERWTKKRAERRRG